MTAATIRTCAACRTTRRARGRCRTSPDHADAEANGVALRSERDVPADLHRRAPLPEDPTPAWNGYSVGAWEGDTLVVRTQGFRDDLWIDTGGSPMSDVAKMTERIRRPNYGTLDIELTIDDPKNYTKPFTVNLSQHIELDTELVDEFCLENEKSYNGCSDPAASRLAIRYRLSGSKSVLFSFTTTSRAGFSLRRDRTRGLAAVALRALASLAVALAEAGSPRSTRGVFCGMAEAS